MLVFGVVPALDRPDREGEEAIAMLTPLMLALLAWACDNGDVPGEKWPEDPFTREGDRLWFNCDEVGGEPIGP